MYFPPLPSCFAPMAGSRWRTDYEVRFKSPLQHVLFNFMVHIGKCIEHELRSQRRSVKWLADQLFCDRSNVYRLLQRESVDTAQLMRISRILECNFFEAYIREYTSHSRRPASKEEKNAAS